jgi:uncharacterized protein YhhL (DUF1145 family)
MRSSTNTPPAPSGFSAQAIVLAEIAWAFMALMFFLMFSTANPITHKYPDWYSWGTSVFELVAYLSASLLCFRNSFSPQIVSGRRVWLGLGLGMLLYFIGSLIFTYWETVLQREAAVTPGDLFYVPTYFCLLFAMFMAVLDRKLNLSAWQWGLIAAIATIGTAIAIGLFNMPDLAEKPTALGQTSPVAMSPAPQFNSLMAQTTTKTAPPIGKPKPASKSEAKPEAGPESAKPETGKSKLAPAAEAAASPSWVLDVEKLLAPFEKPLNVFYIVADVFLLIIATTLLMAFWGGRFSQSWRMIAAATFCLYISDVWFKYAQSQIKDYQSGGLLEVGWVFCGALFAIGAALEYSLSQSRRGAGRRRA